LTLNLALLAYALYRRAKTLQGEGLDMGYALVRDGDDRSGYDDDNACRVVKGKVDELDVEKEKLERTAKA
jgi:hypothetical protein